MVYVSQILENNHYKNLDMMCLNNKKTLENNVSELTDILSDILNEVHNPQNIIITGIGTGHLLLSLTLMYPRANIICFDQNSKKCASYITGVNDNVRVIVGDLVDSVSLFVKQNVIPVQLIVHNTVCDSRERNLQFFITYDLCEQNSTISFINTDDVNVSNILGYSKDGLISIIGNHSNYITSKIDIPTPKIAVCSDICSGLSYPHDSKKKYCEKYGYTLECTGYKEIIKLLEKSVDDERLYTYVLWIPSTTYIMNIDIRISSFIRGKEIRDITVDMKGLPSFESSFVIKNTEWSRSFFSSFELGLDSIDQSRITPNVHIPFASLFNYDPQICIGLHLPSYSLDRKSVNPYCPVKMDFETEEAYNSRLKWIMNESKHYILWLSKNQPSTPNI